MELIPKKDKTELSTQTDNEYSCLLGGLQINLPIVRSPHSLKIEIQGFNDFHIIWLNKIYRDYEGRIWKKIISNDNREKFHCLFCNKILCRFHSLRSHLNKHLDIYPFKCCVCEKKYISNESLMKHCQSKHLTHLALNQVHD